MYRLFFLLSFLFFVTAVTSPICAAEQRTSVTGVTHPAKDETISSLVSGKIASINFEEGDKVEKGDVLIELDKRENELKVERRKVIWQSKVKRASAKARMDTYKAQLGRMRKLYESTQSVSKEELNKKKLEYKLAKAKWEQQKLKEKQEKIEYEMAKEQLQRRSITSPLNGTVTSVKCEAGETCQPHEELMRVVNVEEFYIVAHIPPRASDKLEIGQSATLTITRLGNEGVEVKGDISFISPVVDSASGLREIRARFDNPQERIPPGMSGKLTFSTREPE